jgi:monomeric isocitrate dehydrogenase
MPRDCDVRMELVMANGQIMRLKETTSLLKDEIIDSMFMSKSVLACGTTRGN